jgi:hypothetical protein
MLALLPIEYLFSLLKMLLHIFVPCLANLFHYILLLCRSKNLKVLDLVFNYVIDLL